jgi:hypothetical protein
MKSMWPDPKWLEVLKSGGWTFTGLAVGCAVLTYLNRAGYIELHPYAGQAFIVGGVLSFFLALAALADVLQRASKLPVAKIARWRARRAERKLFEGYIPHFTERERQIFGYLIAKNQRVFTADSDGGYAATLLSMGFVRIIAHPGQHVDPFAVPMGIPDPVWDALIEHKDAFPYTPEYWHDRSGRVEAHPWRIRRV